MFLRALEMGFAPSQFNDPKGALFKLCQTTTVSDYQAAFKTLASRITSLPPQFYLSCFISNLKSSVPRGFQAFQVTSLLHAISLAKLQEDKICDCSSSFPTYRTKTHHHQSPRTLIHLSNAHHPSPCYYALKQANPKPTTPIYARHKQKFRHDVTRV